MVITAALAENIITLLGLPPDSAQSGRLHVARRLREELDCGPTFYAMDAAAIAELEEAVANAQPLPAKYDGEI